MPIPPRPGGVEIAAMVSVLPFKSVIAVVSVEAPRSGLRQHPAVLVYHRRMKRTTIIIGTNWVDILSAANRTDTSAFILKKASST
jgi:hypothetical protein